MKSHLQPSEACEHETNHRQIDHGFAGLGLTFVVAIEASVASQPPKGALYDPASRQHLEGMKFGAFHDLDGTTPQSLGPIQERSPVASVGPDVFDPPGRRLAEEGGQQLLGTVAVLNVGRQDHYHQDQADGID